MDKAHEDICNLRERIAKAEGKIEAADKALTVAKDSVSKNNLGLIATFILSVLGLMIEWVRK